MMRRDIILFGQGDKAPKLAKSDDPLEQQLDKHFVWNHFPPVPAALIPLAIDAIRMINMGQEKESCAIPGEYVVTGDPNKSPTAYEIANALGLWAWQCECDACARGELHWRREAESA